MRRSFSIIIRQAIKFRLESGEDDNTIITATGVSIRQLRKMRRNWEQFNEVAKPQLAAGRRKKLNQQQIDQLLRVSGSETYLLFGRDVLGFV